METQQKTRRLEYKWVIIAAGFLMVFTCLGLCSSNKGLYLSAITEALATQIVTPLIYEAGNPFGYRNAYQLVALILLIVGALAVILFRDAPKEIAANLPKKKAKGQSIRSITFREAILKPYFYVAAICIFFTGSALQGVNGISAAHMTDSGLDAGYVATVLSVHSLALAGSKFLTGLAYDKIGLKKTC